MRVGVIDVGTNSVRLLVAEGDGGPLHGRERDLTITRLGEGVDRDGRLGSEPLRRTVAAIAGYAERCDLAGCVAIRIIATSAVRDAANRDDFAAAVRRATGLDADVLTGEQEARLGFAGATMLAAPAPFLVADIGGGSTELVRGAQAVDRWVSLDVGSVRLTERHIRSDPPRRDEIDAVRADADRHLDRAVAEIGGEPAGTLLGLAGTITTVAAIALGLAHYDRDRVHGARLTRSQVATIGEQLAAMTSAERRRLPVMPAGREDVIVAGVSILEAIMDRFAADAVLVSETDILDGAADETIQAVSRGTL